MLLKVTPRGPKTWIDRLVDVVIGDEGPETKYALICTHCFAHNGLVLPSEVDDIRKLGLNLKIRA